MLRPDAEHRGDLAPHGHRRRRFLAGEHDAEHLVLVGELARTGRVHVADLEQRDTGTPVRLVERHRIAAAQDAATGAARPRRRRAGW